jgi:CRP-like cAMP-binding protein
LARHFLRSNGWLSVVEPEFADAVLEASHFRTFERGQVLSEGGAVGGAMVGIVSGQVGVRWDNGCSDSELAHIGLPGSWWGSAPLWDVPREAEARARTHVQALQIDIRDLRAIIGRVEGGWRALGLHAVDVIAQLITAHDDLMIKDMRRRFIMVLLRLAGHRREPILPMKPESISVSHDELARAANLTRSPVARILHELEAGGFVRLEYRTITIVDPKGLAALAQAEWG